MNSRPQLACLLLGVAAAAFSPAASAAVVAVANLSVETIRTSPNPAHPGDAIVYQTTVSNAGPEAAANLVLTETFPAGAQILSEGSSGPWSCIGTDGTGTISCTAPTLAAGAGGASASLTLRTLGTAASPMVNTETVSSDTLDPDHSDNTSSISTDIVIAPTPTVPALSAAGLAGLGAVLALAGLVALRRSTARDLTRGAAARRMVTIWLRI